MNGIDLSPLPAPAAESILNISPEHLRALFGSFDENINALESIFGVRIHQRGASLLFFGPQEAACAAKETVAYLLASIERGEAIDRTGVKVAAELVTNGQGEHLARLMKDVVGITYRGKQVKAKTVGQKQYLELMKKKTVTFGIGPAGTGKTYLAIAQAVQSLKKKEVSRLILTRPAVEAGERLGFLPGDLQQKVDPYLRPLYDALQEFLGQESFQKLQEKGVIEVAPLAYMRGRTLSDSYIILDEAQNCTREQMKMFLTRMGENSKIIVTGDITQIDLPADKQSGLVHVARVLQNVDGIGFAYLTEKDVVRHEIVQNIIRAYEKYEGKELVKGANRHPRPQGSRR